MSDDLLADRVGDLPDPDSERVEARAATLKREHRTDDPEAQAEAMLAESDARVNDPAVRDLKDDRLERRTSDEATPPAEAEPARRRRPPLRRRLRLWSRRRDASGASR